MGSAAPELVLRLSRRIPAPRDRVFALLTEPPELARWWGPRDFTIPDVHVELRVGGRYRITMRPPDGAEFHLSGEYLDVEVPRRLRYTFGWDEPHPDDRVTIVDLTLDDLGEATVVSLVQGDFATPDRLALHEAGWGDSLAKLAALAT